MNISQENRVIAAVERFEAMERDIAAKKPVLKPRPAPKKPKEFTPIEIKRAKADEIAKAKALAKEKEKEKAEKAAKEEEAKANAKTDAGKEAKAQNEKE